MVAHRHIVVFDAQPLEKAELITAAPKKAELITTAPEKAELSRARLSKAEPSWAELMHNKKRRLESAISDRSCLPIEAITAAPWKIGVVIFVVKSVEDEEKL